MNICIKIGLIFLLLHPFSEAQLSPKNPLESEKTSEFDWELVPTITLHEAANQGLVSVYGGEPSGYQSVKLRIKNNSRGRMAVDIAGSHVVPRRSGRRRPCQRLGLGPVITPEVVVKRGNGTAVVLLEPGERKSLRVATCCLDAGRPSPYNEAFLASKDRLPPVREDVLRWWVDNPNVSQSAVNAAIWQNRSKVIVGDGETSNHQVELKKYGTLRSGTYYQLQDGELIGVDADGARRFLGTEILQVIPTKNAVYAVALGEDLRPELWSLAVTGDNPWSFVLDLDSSERIYDVFSAPKNNLVLITENGIKLFDRQKKRINPLIEVAEKKHLSYKRNVNGGLIASVFKGGGDSNQYGGDNRSHSSTIEIWKVNLGKQTKELVKTYWNVSEVLSGPAGIFALSHTGKLRRMLRKSFKDFGTQISFLRILAIGEKILWLQDPDKNIVGVHSLSGKILFKKNVPFVHFDLDPISGDLALTTKDSFYQLKAKDGALVKIEDK